MEREGENVVSSKNWITRIIEKYEGEKKKDKQKEKPAAVIIEFF